MSEVIPFDEHLEERVKEEFGEEATCEFVNMLRVGKAAYEHGYNNFIFKDNFLRWVSEMYDAGVVQREIREGKREGNISINGGDVINAGAHLALFGKEKGYLSK
jgi:hypothetical protein